MLLKIKGKNNATKVLKKWINVNAFDIHEYVQSRNDETYNKLVESLDLLLCHRRGKINIRLFTPFGERIELKFEPETKRTWPKYTILISDNPKKRQINY